MFKRFFVIVFLCCISTVVVSGASMEKEEDVVLDFEVARRKFYESKRAQKRQGFAKMVLAGVCFVLVVFLGWQGVKQIRKEMGAKETEGEGDGVEGTEKVDFVLFKEEGGVKYFSLSSHRDEQISPFEEENKGKEDKERGKGTEDKEEDDDDTACNACWERKKALYFCCKCTHIFCLDCGHAYFFEEKKRICAKCRQSISEPNLKVIKRKFGGILHLLSTLFLDSDS